MTINEVNPGTNIQSGYLPSPYGDPNVMISLSQQLIGLTESYLETLQAAAANLTPPRIVPNFPTIDVPPKPVEAPEPTLIDVVWTTPVQPGAFSGTLNIDGLFPPKFSGQPPTLQFPAQPGEFSGSVPTSPQLDLDFTYPVVSVAFPAPPQLLSLDTVDFDVGNIPSFNVQVPIIQAAAPNVVGFVEPSMYASTLLTSLQTSLNDAITNGANLSLPPEIEKSLWDRAREREYRQQADAIAELERMEEMGFAFPPGVWLDAKLKIQTETNYTIAGLSREIAIEQAKLLLDNITKAREIAVNLEGKFIDYANQIAQRGFESAKYLTQAAIAIYNSQIDQYKASLDGYRTQAMVYDTQIKGILAQVDIVKAKIEYEKTKAQIDQVLIESYRTQVQAAEAVLEMYKTQIEIIQTRATVEKLKVDIFGAQIQAYVGEVNAFTARVEAYKAEVESQGVIEQVFKTQVDAYAAEVAAGVGEANAKVGEFSAQVKAYEAQLQGYTASLQAMVEQARAAALYNTAQADVYRSLTQADAAFNQTLTSQWQAIINEQLQIAQIGVAAAKANGDLYIATEGLLIEASKTGATVASQLGAAALGAIHWANNSSWAVSQSVALQASTSTNTNTNTNTNINE